MAGYGHTAVTILALLQNNRVDPEILAFGAAGSNPVAGR